MKNNHQLNKKEEIIFPTGSGKTIISILKKYGLEALPKELKKRIDEAETFDNKEKIVEGSLGRKTIRILKEVVEDKLPRKNFVSVLQERLGISKDIAKEIAEDLEKEVLTSIERIPIEEETVTTEKKEEVIQKTPILEKEAILPKKETAASDKILTEELSKKPSGEGEEIKSDTYREPIG